MRKVKIKLKELVECSLYNQIKTHNITIIEKKNIKMLGKNKK